MFFAFAYKGDSLRASFDGLGKVVGPSRDNNKKKGGGEWEV